MDNYVGYPVDYKISIDYYSLSLIIDRVGGIYIETDEELLRYTGIQVCDMLSGNYTSEMQFKVLTSFCERLSKNGFSNEDFKFLLSRCDTNLKMPVCLYWQEYVKVMFSNTVFVNWEN